MLRVATKKLLRTRPGSGLYATDPLANILQGQRAHDFPYLEAVIGTDTRDQNVNNKIVIPNDDLRVGDLLIAAQRQTAGSGSFTWPAGWTELADSTADASVDAVTIAYRVVSFDGNESDTVTPTYSTTLDRCVSVVWQFRNAGTPEIGSIVAQTTSAPNPPNLTPAGGAKNYLWFAFASHEGAHTITAFPTNYDLYQGSIVGTSPAGGNACASIAWAFRELNAASEDPGTFTYSASEDNMSTTLAIPPL